MDNHEPLIQVSDVESELPTLEYLLSLDQNIQKRVHRGFDQLGLILKEPANWENGGYYCTPINSLCFGTTGTDGEHFSFLVQDEVINNQSPVIVTAPCAYHNEIRNAVIAKNFYDFLCLGLQFGYFALVEFVWNCPEALQAYSSKGSNKTNYKYPGFNQPLDAQTQENIVLIKETLSLELRTFESEQFTQLQTAYMPLLIMSAEY